MSRIITIATIAGAMAVGIVGIARADDDHDRRDRRDRRQHEVCSMVTKCHHDDGRRICVKERVCHMVSDRR